MSHVHRKRLIVGLFFLMAMFIIVFLIALNGLQRGYTLLNSPFGELENWGIMVLCVLSMIKVIHELGRV